jgi:2'-5' RNA ligase
MSRGHTARLFVAVDPPPAVAERLAAWGREIARGDTGAELRVLDPLSLHLTLLFLGERPVEEIDELAGALARSAGESPRFEVETGGPLWLPPRRPRTLAVEAHDHSGQLEDLQRAVAASLGPIAGIEERRRFRAHISVARLRSGARPHAAEPLAPTPEELFDVSEAVLYRSWLEPRAARYEALATVALAAEGTV